MPSGGDKAPRGPARDLLVPTLLVLTLVLFIPQAFRPGSFLASLDLVNIHYPSHEWMHALLKEGRLPLLTDLAYHGAPVAGLSVLGFLSPVFWAVHAVIPSAAAAFQFLFIAPLLLFLLGSYALGRGLGMSRSASFLLAFLWTYHGRNMAQLDHLNVLWGQAFFPWTLRCALGSVRSGKPVPAFGAGLLAALGLLSGHPQMVFLQALFFPFFLFGMTEGTLRRKWSVLFQVLSGALLFTAPLLLHSAETLGFDRPGLSWSNADRFYHSWTPFNPLTLLFPWFFGKTAYDGTSDYWWQYQFVEMQMALSCVGLFFALLFFLRKGGRRLPLGLAAALFLYLSLGKFSLLYRLLQETPLVGSFRGPARYTYPAVWALGLSAAYAWDRWSSEKDRLGTGRSLSAALLGIAAGLVAVIKLLTGPLHRQLEAFASRLIDRWITADPTYPHHQDAAYFADRIAGKIDHLSRACDLSRPEVFLPLLILTFVLLAVWTHPRWDPRILRLLLLTLVLADLWAFRMPFGDAWTKASDLPAPMVPAPENRMISQVSGTIRPSPFLARSLGYPNSNLPFGRPALDIVLGGFLSRYGTIEERLGWFSWVYREREPNGFLKHPNLLRALGVDLLVSDQPLPALPPFKTVNREFPFVLKLDGDRPKALWVARTRTGSWPAILDRMDERTFDPLQETFVEEPFRVPPLSQPERTPSIRSWTDGHILIDTSETKTAFLVLQKSFLPAWKAKVNGNSSSIYRCDGVLMGILLPPGPCRVELDYHPAGLRLGWFLFLSAFSILAAIGMAGWGGRRPG